MNGWPNFFFEPWVQRLGWALIHFLWQGAGMALLLAVALRLLARASAHIRYVVIAGALFLCAVLPMATWTLLGTPAQLAASSAPASVPGEIPKMETPVALESGFHPNAAIESPSHVPMRWQDKLGRMADTALPYLVGLWLGGVLVLTLRLTLVWTLLRRRCLSGAPIRDARCLERFGGLLERMRIDVPVRLLQSALVEVPTLIGWLRPTILVPASVFTGLTPEQLEAILAHELAHVRRYDYLVNLFQTAIETILFYHPAIWWISRKLREERENCCDDIALEVMQDRLTYVSALARLEEGRGLSLALMASGGSLLHRIRRIAGANDRKVSAWPWAIIALVLIVGVGISIRTTKADAPAIAVTPTANNSTSSSLPARDVKVTISLSGKLKNWIRLEHSTGKHEWDDASVSRIDLSPIAINFGQPGLIEQIRVFPYPIAFDAAETVENPDHNQVIIPITPTDFKRENIGWRVTVIVEKGKDGIIKLQGIATHTSAAFSHGAYGETSGPIYKDLKNPQTGKLEHVLVASNASALPIFQTSVTPFFVFAKSGQSYVVQLQSGTDSVAATIRCELLGNPDKNSSSQTTDTAPTIAPAIMEHTVYGHLFDQDPSPIDYAKSQGELVSVDGTKGRHYAFTFQADGTFIVPDAAPGIYNVTVHLVPKDSTHTAGDDFVDMPMGPLTVTATSARTNYNGVLRVSFKKVKGSIIIGLKVMEIEDAAYLANKEKVDTAVENGDFGFFNNLKGAAWVATPSVTTQPGLKANIDFVREFPYPTSFDSAKVVQGATAQGMGTDLTLKIPPWPRDFVIKEIGLSAEITPTIDASNSSYHGKIILNGKLNITDFEGFTKSNMTNIGMPAFDNRESLFVEALDDNQQKGIWIPGGRFDEQTIADKDTAGKIVSEKTEEASKRLALFVSASRVK